MASGPGSFTGLRVGLAAVKGLAEILEKPIAAISRLEVVARSGNSHGKVIAALDAGRNEVYVGEYEVNERAEIIGERLVSREEFLNQPGECEGRDAGAHSRGRGKRRRGFPWKIVAQPNSAAIARIGIERIMRGETISPEDLEANYIRRSDAEIFAKK